ACPGSHVSTERRGAGDGPRRPGPCPGKDRDHRVMHRPAARFRSPYGRPAEAPVHRQGDKMTSNTQLRDAAGEADLTFEDPQGQGKRYSRLFGALFLARLLVYGIGFGLVSSVTTAPDFMSTLAANSTVLVV